MKIDIDSIADFMLKHPGYLARTINKATAEEFDRFSNALSIELNCGRLAQLNYKVSKSLNTIFELEKLGRRRSK